jgi:hypothetical protein
MCVSQIFLRRRLASSPFVVAWPCLHPNAHTLSCCHEKTRRSSCVYCRRMDGEAVKKRAERGTRGACKSDRHSVLPSLLGDSVREEVVKPSRSAKVGCRRSPCLFTPDYESESPAARRLQALLFPLQTPNPSAHRPDLRPTGTASSDLQKRLVRIRVSNSSIPCRRGHRPQPSSLAACVN